MPLRKLKRSLSLNLGTRAASIITVLRPIDLTKVTADTLMSETTTSMMIACTRLAELAQACADPRYRGKDETKLQNAALCREIVKHAADCKLNLCTLMTKQLTEEQMNRAASKAIKEYAAMKSAIARLFPAINLHWGRSIPQLL
jgi:hypothetical protein